MRVACLDLEGVLVPEIWQAVASHTGISELQLTTRDVPDYHELMQQRLQLLDRHGITIHHIREVIGSLTPLPGAREFMRQLRARTQVVILSDTYEEFAAPLMAQLDWPTLFCNSLSIDETGRIREYHLRQDEGKLRAVRAFKSMNLTVYAAGDSYNDLSMILEADTGAFFRPPASIVRENPEVPAMEEYPDLLEFLVS
ncbi:MAG: bifunctional phosphoserine phosphatase/homoserine phosphotransferase ThrH [Alkalispirochaeta sp.]